MAKQAAKTKGSKQVKQPKAKLLYDYIQACPDCGHHGTVYLHNREAVPVEDPQGVNRLCQLMDDISVQRFRRDIESFQILGKLMNLASPEVRLKWQGEQDQKQLQAQKAREATLHALIKRQEELGEESRRLRKAKLNKRALIKPVIDLMEKALLDKPDLKDILEEICRRGWSINIKVERTYANNQDASINPLDLIEQDVSAEEAKLRDAKNALDDEFRKVK